MSDQPQPPRITTTHSSSGSVWKWVGGAALAALLVGGGYYAWTNFNSSHPNAQIASNTASSTEASTTEPSEVAPLPADQTAGAPQQESTPSETAAAPTPEVQPAASAPVHHRAPAHAAAQPVPEEVVGVTPASVTTDNDVIVVPGSRRPVWSRTPTAYRLSGLYPEYALETGREGEASVHCTVRNSGRLNCVRMSETPANAGFGNAALRVASLFRHAPERRDGTPAAGTPIDLRVVFRMADEDQRRG